jgi:hypothetical protein
MKDCVEWKGSFRNDGYGYIYWNKQDNSAHRVIHEIVNGPIPKGCMVLHTCDNPKCVNPKHLYLGDGKQNAQDRVARRAKPWFALTDKQIQRIRELKGKMSQDKIAKEIGCSQTTVCRWIDG